MLNRLAPIAALLVCLSVFAWIQTFASSFQNCVSEHTGHYAQEATKEKNSIIKVFVFSRCSARFVEEHNGGVTALATLIIAAFTATIWAINWGQLRHSHQVERAYISVDVVPQFHKTEPLEIPKGMTGGGFSLPAFTSATGNFEIRLSNNGKTPGEVFEFNYEI